MSSNLERVQESFIFKAHQGHIFQNSSVFLFSGEEVVEGPSHCELSVAVV